MNIAQISHKLTKPISSMPVHQHIQIVFSIILMTTLVSQSSAEDSLESIRGETMGTTYSIKWIGIKWIDESTGESSLKVDVDARLAEINRLMSTYDPDSELSRFNQYEKTDWFPVSSATAIVVTKALEISELSNGAFDPTVGRLVRLWNFGPDPNTQETPAKEEIEAALESVGYQLVKVQSDPPAISKSNPKVEIDLSAIAKGYAVDQILKLLQAENVKDCMVEIGGEVRTSGTKQNGEPWTLGLQHPESLSSSLYAKVELKDQALATSGNYRNYFERDGVRYSHMIDPRTGKPVLHQLASASVLADDCMTADAWATTLMVLGSEQGLKLADQHQMAAYLLERKGDSFRELASEAIVGQFVNITQVDPKDPGMSPYLSTFLLAATVFLIAIVGLAAGVILSNKTLKGSCGGIEGQKDEEGRSICEMCTTPPEECDQMKEKLREQLKTD